MFGWLDARAAAEWGRFTDHAAYYGLAVVTVVDVYQFARHGTKAVIVTDGDSRPRDAWFWWERVEIGMTLAVTLSSGYGPHTHRSGVIYVGDQVTGTGVLDRLTLKTLKRARRHQLRDAAKQARMTHGMQRATATPTGPR